MNPVIANICISHYRAAEDCHTTAEAEIACACSAVRLLRDAGVEDAEILKDYADPTPRPRADRAMESEYFKECGVVISAIRVRAHIVRLLTH